LDTLLSKASRRFLLAQSLVAILGIALGGTVVTSVDIARVSAERTFEAVADRATHQILGGPDGLSAVSALAWISPRGSGDRGARGGACGRGGAFGRDLPRPPGRPELAGRGPAQ
jgi:hypothetical protein